MARLPRVVGRGRAMEILIGADDFDGELAERYGYVNRALPDAELDGFVDALAIRIASFDQQAIHITKNGKSGRRLRTGTLNCPDSSPTKHLGRSTNCARFRRRRR
jgi:enoyl-CoA hydratase/carnithine racemase